jgi:hypothetical protein
VKEALLYLLKCQSHLQVLAQCAIFKAGCMYVGCTSVELYMHLLCVVYLAGVSTLSHVGEVALHYYQPLFLLFHMHTWMKGYAGSRAYGLEVSLWFYEARLNFNCGFWAYE